MLEPSTTIHIGASGIEDGAETTVTMNKPVRPTSIEIVAEPPMRKA
jgi:hypothetical protein